MTRQQRRAAEREAAKPRPKTVEVKRIAAKGYQLRIGGTLYISPFDGQPIYFKTAKAALDMARKIKEAIEKAIEEQKAKPDVEPGA